MNLGKRIKIKRKELGMTQEELGNMLDVSKVSVCQWEKDCKKPSTANLIRLANIFKVSLEYLIGNDVNIIDKEGACLTRMSNDEVMVIQELKKHKELYEMVTDNPKRTLDLIDKRIL